jgi:hypothetical protein
LSLSRPGERNGLLIRLNQGFDRMQVYGAAVTRFDALSPNFRSLRKPWRYATVVERPGLRLKRDFQSE